MISWECNILCDSPDCSCIITGEPATMKLARQSAVNEAFSEGWKKVRGKWICNECLVEAAAVIAGPTSCKT
jgi:hypothetical protein